jgi:outer membrane protein insertion porin family
LTFRRVAPWLAALVVPLVLAASASAADTRRRVAILPIVVHSHEQQDYLQSGLADMLASRLGRAPGVAVIRVNDPTQGTTDLTAAQAAARAVGAEYVLFGSFTRFGEGASLDIRCAGVGESEADAARSVFIQAGTLGEIIPRLDPLAQKIGRYVASGELPDVAATGGEGRAAGGEAVRRELETLRGRVEALEGRVFGEAGGDDVEEVEISP